MTSLPNKPLPSQQIYSATYSNVPVYEYITPNGSIMRRKADAWVNATHILKVAGFPKAKRTRILERDVQSGVHEKVQGGYGKYQGTWVPLERGKELAEAFEVDLLLAPIFDVLETEDANAHPPAPKHHHISSKASKLALATSRISTRNATPTTSVTNTTTNNNTKPSAAKKMASFPLMKNTSTSSATTTNPTNATRSSGASGAAMTTILKSGANKKRGRPPKATATSAAIKKSLSSNSMAATATKSSSGKYSPPPQLPPIVNALPKPETRSMVDYSTRLPSITSIQPNRMKKKLHIGNGVDDDEDDEGIEQEDEYADENDDDDIEDDDNEDNFNSSPISSDINDTATTHHHHHLHQASSSPSDFMSDTDLAAVLRSPENPLNNARNNLEHVLTNNHNNNNSNNHNHNHNNHNGRHYYQESNFNDSIGNNLSTSDTRRASRPKWFDSYKKSLLEYFQTPDDGINEIKLPDFLIYPPTDFDINISLDKDDNTTLHWACSIGDLTIIEALLKNGANSRFPNREGQVPLMRAVSFTNSYTKRSFTRLLFLLRDSLLDSDNNGRTLLHLIAASTNSSLRLTAAKYYMEMLLNRIVDSQPEKLSGFINHQDKDGATALHILVRNRAKKCYDMLMGYGARNDIPDNQGITADYLLGHNDYMRSSNSDSQFAQSQPQPINPYYQHYKSTNSLNSYYQHAQQSTTAALMASNIGPHVIPTPHYSEAAIQANQTVTSELIDKLSDLSNAYDKESQQKEEELSELKNMMNNISAEIQDFENKKATKNFADDIDLKLSESQNLFNLKQSKLKKILERSQAKDLASLVQLKETEMIKEKQEEAEGNDNDDNDKNSKDSINEVIGLTLLQLKRKMMVEKLLLAISKNSDTKINKYKHLISLCIDENVDDDLLDTLIRNLGSV